VKGGKVNDKKELLEAIKSYVDAGMLSKDDLATLFPDASPLKPNSNVAVPSSAKSEKTSATGVTVMFVVGGLLIYGAIQSMLGLMLGSAMFEDGALILAVINLMIGAVAWYLAYSTSKKDDSDTNKGLTTAALVVGAIGVIAGWSFVLEAIGIFTENMGAIEFGFIGSVVALLGAASFIIFDRFLNKDGIAVIGLLCIVIAAFSFVHGMMKGMRLSADVWVIVLLMLCGLTVAMPRLFRQLYDSRPEIAKSLNTIAIFLFLAITYVATFFNGSGLLWALVQFVGIFGVYYLSITTKSKNNLISASFFLIVGVNTLIYRYFSGYGVPLALMLSAASIIGAAMMTVNLDKKYFKDKTAGQLPQDEQ
jgi:hypothetical protein